MSDKQVKFHMLQWRESAKTFYYKKRTILKNSYANVICPDGVLPNCRTNCASFLCENEVRYLSAKDCMDDIANDGIILKCMKGYFEYFLKESDLIVITDEDKTEEGINV